MYQSTNYTKVIEIEAINHNVLYALYNPRRKRGQYIKCPKFTWKFSANRNYFISQTDVHIYECKLNGDIIHIFKSEELPLIKIKGIERVTGNNVTHTTYQEGMSVDELFTLLSHSVSLQPIVHIEEEPTDEQYQEWKKKQKEWYFLRDCRRKEKYKTAREEKEKELKRLAEDHLKIAEMVELSNLSYSTIWRDISRGTLPAIRKYDTFLVKKEDFQIYLQARQK